MHYLKRVDDAITADRQEERLPEQPEEARKRAEVAALPKIEYCYTATPEQAAQAKRAEVRMRLVQAQQDAEEGRRRASEATKIEYRYNPDPSE